MSDHKTESDETMVLRMATAKMVMTALSTGSALTKDTDADKLETFADGCRKLLERVQREARR